MAAADNADASTDEGPEDKASSRRVPPAQGGGAPAAALQAEITDAIRAAIGLSALAVFVGAFAVGHWFRVRKPFHGVLRTVHDPVVASLLGITAALMTAGLVWLAMRRRSLPAAVGVVVLGGVGAAFVNALLWLVGLMALRTHIGFLDTLWNMRGTLYTTAWVVPPGLFWGVGTATVVLLVFDAIRKRAPDVLDQALWSGGLWLTAAGEACAVTLGEGTLPLAITVAGMVLGLVLVGSVIKRRPLADPPEGFVTRRKLVQNTLAALLVAQAWVGVIWFYWKR